MDILLNDAEVRVLGALMEKEATTPDYYPLSLNAVINACNQKSNRDPVMTLSEPAVREALDGLYKKGLAGPTSTAESRVTKYEHRIGETFNLGRRESALLCVLLLRGPQTPGELLGRGERMHRFEDLGEVQSMLQRLIEFNPPLVKMLPRQPGTKESRYVHLLSGEVETWEPASTAGQSAFGNSSESERIARLETDVATLQSDIADLKQEVAELRKHFD
ncbi:MAG: YceH family protein [Acidobacteria bacterium]|nr:YceH family protein [Acidobacteriota bacterium]